MDSFGKQEIHINGDVALAFRQYFYLTQVLLPSMTLNQPRNVYVGQTSSKKKKIHYSSPFFERTLDYLKRAVPVKWCGV